jgi:hypothetical protein
MTKLSNVYGIFVSVGGAPPQHVPGRNCQLDFETGTVTATPGQKRLQCCVIDPWLGTCQIFSPHQTGQKVMGNICGKICRFLGCKKFVVGNSIHPPELGQCPASQGQSYNYFKNFSPVQEHRLGKEPKNQVRSRTSTFLVFAKEGRQKRQI